MQVDSLGWSQTERCVPGTVPSLFWSVRLLAVLGQSQPGAMAAHRKGCVLVLWRALLYRPAPLVLMCIWAEVHHENQWGARICWSWFGTDVSITPGWLSVVPSPRGKICLHIYLAPSAESVQVAACFTRKIISWFCRVRKTYPKMGRNSYSGKGM